MTEIPEPRPANDRGFLTYAGGPIRTDAGHEITVQESSGANGPHVWLFVTDREGQASDSPAPHLGLEQAILLRGALGQFIDGTPERWEGGAKMLAAATTAVTGPVARRFVLRRSEDVTGMSGAGDVADGVLWPDGTASVRWRGEWPSVVFWDGGIADAEHVHGHGGLTRVVFLDGADGGPVDV